MKSLAGVVARVPKPIAVVALAVVLAAGVLVGIVLVNGDGARNPRHVVVGTPSTTTTVPPDAVPKIEAGPTPTGPMVSVRPVSAAKPQPSKTSASTGPTTTTTAISSTATTAPSTTTTTTTAPPKQSADVGFAYPSGPGDAIEEKHVYVVGLGDGLAHSVYTNGSILDRNEWSADGRRVLVSHDETHDHDVLSMNLDGTGPAKLGHVTFEAATWSALGDLATIDYDGTGHELVITKPNGAEVRIEHEDVGAVSGRSWSADGSHIAFIADGRVWTATADGADVTPLTPIGSKAWRWLRWSPDESMIAFHDHQQLFVVDADGTDLRQLGPVNNDPSFDWSPDSTKLVVCAPFTPSATRLNMSIVPVDGSAPTPLGVQGQEVSWSPDGSTIAYKSYPWVSGGGTPIAVIDPDGANRRVLASPPSGVYFGLGLDWSPDSTHLLVNTGNAGPGGASEPT